MTTTVSHRSVAELRNIGKTIAQRLQQAGITSEAELRACGSVEAHRRIKQQHPDVTLPVCYYLYAFEGALSDQHWNDIGEARKQELLAALGKPR